MARAKKKQKQTPRHENWISRDGNQRPTDERRHKGMFRLVDSEDAGVSYSIDQCSSMAGLYYAIGLIDGTQFDAAGQFERIARSRRGSPSQRSCLDFSPVGYEAPDDTDADEANMREWRDLCSMYSAAVRDVLSMVCWEHRDFLGVVREVKRNGKEGEVILNKEIPTKKHKILCLGLDIVADFYKI